MLNKFVVILICCSFSLGMASEKPTEFLIGDTKFNVSVPSQWQAAPGLYGAELALLGEITDKKRPVIMIDRIPLDDFNFDKDELTDSYENFKAGRRKWFKKNFATEKEFFPYAVESWNHIKEVHKLSYSYVMLNKTYVEKYYFFNCEGKMFNVHTLATIEQDKKEKKTLKGILNSLNCK